MLSNEIGEMTIISRKYGILKTLFDLEDLEKMQDYVWRVCWDPKKNGFYVYGSNYKKKILSLRLQRFLTNCTDKKLKVDHINGDTLDNRKSNLRICTNAENSRNSAKSKNGLWSKYKGVHKDRNRFVARIKVDYKEINLGSFKHEINAAIAYNNAAIKYHKDFARLNAIPDGPYPTENEKPVKTSEYRGVCKDKNKFRAILYHNSKIYHLGLFASEIDAVAAYNLACENMGLKEKKNEITYV